MKKITFTKEEKHDGKTRILSKTVTSPKLVEILRKEGWKEIKEEIKSKPRGIKKVIESANKGVGGQKSPNPK